MNTGREGRASLATVHHLVHFLLPFTCHLYQTLVIHILAILVSRPPLRLGLDPAAGPSEEGTEGLLWEGWPQELQGLFSA